MLENYWDDARNNIFQTEKKYVFYGSPVLSTFFFSVMLFFNRYDEADTKISCCVSLIFPHLISDFSIIFTRF